MALTERRRQLLQTDRWRPLAAFVERWYAHPLSDTDGNTPIEIAVRTARLGCQLPASLIEWFELVGQRLRDVQDLPCRLADLRIEGGSRVPIWMENQGVWSISAPLDAGDDPPCRVEGEFNAPLDAPLSSTLLSMLLSDTLVGAWAGARIGPLGALRATVRGGLLFDEFTDAHVERAQSAFEALAIPRNPFFPEPYRGDNTTVIRLQDVAIEWMTASDEAFTALDRVLNLQPASGEHEVVVAFTAISDAQQHYLTVDHESGLRFPNTDRLQAMLGDAGHVGKAAGGHEPRFHISTCNPRHVAQLVLEALPADLRTHVTIAMRPAAISIFEVLYPADRKTFMLPGNSDSGASFVGSE
jgi:hypothetical protein